MPGQKKTALAKKLYRLNLILSSMKSVLVAYSGGVDSTFLLKAASDVLGGGVLAVTALSETFPPSEAAFAKREAKRLGACHKVIHTRELADERFTANTKDRCYFCKHELFSELKNIADAGGYNFIVDGANADDRQDYRPGHRAGKELGVRSPLDEAGLTKEDIRVLSKRWGLRSADKPSLACLASRIPYGTKIDRQKLNRVNRAEDAIRRFGVGQVRVRDHGDTARIEILPHELSKLVDGRVRKKLVAALKKLGYTYISLDLEGYRTGSMNAPLAA